MAPSSPRRSRPRYPIHEHHRRSVAEGIGASDLRTDPGPFYDIADAQGEELQLLTSSVASACLTAHGGNVVGDSSVAVFDPSVSQVEVWDSCVIETKKIVAERLTAMNVPPVKTS